MIKHSELGETAASRRNNLRSRIKSGEINFAGNLNLKIFGRLNCTSGKRMKTENRVFFKSKAEAEKAGFRPCGHCMREEYKNWKGGSI